MKTQSRLEKGYKKIIEFELDKDELDRYRKTSFEKFRKSAKIDGFRPGMAPESMLKSKYGAGIEVEAMNDAINSSYKSFIIENKIYPLSEPVIDNVDKKDENLKFTATLETFPEFDLNSYTGMTIEHEKVVVTPEEISTALNDILDRHATSKEVDEPVAIGHMVDVAIKPTNVPDAKWENQSIEIGKNPNDTVDKELIGLKKDQIKTVSINPTGQEGQSFELDIKIEKVGKKILPELNDEFAKTYDTKFPTVGEMKKNIADNIEKNKLNAQEMEVFEKFAKRITDAHDNFEVPPSILNKYLDDMVANAQKQYGKNIDKNMLRDLYKQNAEVALKWEYIRHKIMEKENLTVTDEDVDSKISQLAEEREMDVEKIRKYYSSKEKKQMMKEDLLDKKLREFLKEKNTVNFVEPAEAKE